MKEVEIKPTYYNKFKCSADKCLYSCCINWNISFDDEAIEKYACLNDEELSEYILNNISPATKKATLKKGYCPFLDVDSLCKIQKKCGEDFLCTTCKTFPRIRRTIGNIIKRDIDIACPEVLKIIKNEKIFTDNYVVEIKEDKCELLKLGEINKKYFKQLFNLLKFVYNKKYNYKKNMFILLNFANDCTKFISKKTNKGFNAFKNKFNEDYFNCLAKQYSPKKDESFLEQFQSDIFSFSEEKISNKDFYFLREKYKELNFKDKQTIKQNKKINKLIDTTLNLNNLFFYIINLTITDSIKFNNFLDNVKFAIINICFLKLYGITKFDITKQKTINNLYVLMSCIFRTTFHSKFFDNLSEMLSIKLLSTDNLIKYTLSI